MKITLTWDARPSSISESAETADSLDSEMEERKVLTRKIESLKRYAEADVPPCTPTPKKPIPLDPLQAFKGENLHSQESLTSAISSLTTKPKKRKYRESLVSAKRFRGVFAEVKSFVSEFIHNHTGESKFFRCYCENDIVYEPIAKGARLVENIYDDDCDTDEEQITQAVGLVKRQLEQAIDLATNLM